MIFGNNNESTQRILNSAELGDEVSIVSLRPKLLNEYIGQSKIKERLNVSIQAAKKRKDVLDHVLLAGPPGLGKTTMANVIANEMKSNIQVTSGPVLEKAGDLAAILTNLAGGDILFIDEIHRLNRSVEEILYSAVEDFKLDIVIGKGPSARSIRLDLKPFTLIGATTRTGLIAAPLRSRFGIILEMSFYTDDDLKLIVCRSAELLKAAISEEAALLIAQRSRGTPRIANRLLKRVRDTAQVKGRSRIEVSEVDETMSMLDIDTYGLDEMDRKLLNTVTQNYKGGPVGVKALAASLGIEPDSISEVYEPYLLQNGYLIRTSRGRMITEKGLRYLGYSESKINSMRGDQIGQSVNQKLPEFEE
jgi:Holliday junction DNA helicase RuvB